MINKMRHFNNLLVFLLFPITVFTQDVPTQHFVVTSSDAVATMRPQDTLGEPVPRGLTFYGDQIGNWVYFRGTGFVRSKDLAVVSDHFEDGPTRGPIIPLSVRTPAGDFNSFAPELRFQKKKPFLTMYGFRREDRTRAKYWPTIFRGELSGQEYNFQRVGGLQEFITVADLNDDKFDDFIFSGPSLNGEGIVPGIWVLLSHPKGYQPLMLIDTNEWCHCHFSTVVKGWPEKMGASLMYYEPSRKALRFSHPDGAFFVVLSHDGNWKVER
jgi:hypothetical protein